MPAHATPDPAVAKLIEKQLRNWELARDQRPEPQERDRTRQVEDFVTISRMVGSGGGEVARLLSERLGWAFFDREVFWAMAGDDRVRQRLYESMDERDTNWLDDAVRWIVRGEIPRQDYFHKLSHTVLALARQGRGVYLGRAVDLILPRERGLRVRIAASAARCAENYATRRSIGLAEARGEIEQIEVERGDFVRHHFRVSGDPAARFDLTICLDNFSAGQAVDVIGAAMTARGIEAPGRRAHPNPSRE